MDIIPYELIMQTMQDGLFALSDGKLIYANDALHKMLGGTKGEAIGRPLEELIWPEDVDFVVNRHKRRLSGENVPNEYQFRLKHKNGTAVHVVMTIGFTEFDGKITAVGTMKNITDRIESEIRIKEMESSYKILLELVPDPIIVSDFNGNIIMHNQAAYDVHEPISSDFRLIGKNVLDFIATDEERVKISQMVPAELDFVEYTINFETQKGKIIPFELHTTTIYNINGVPTGKLTIGRDMSQIKKLLKEKETMIVEIHHRIKNSLQQIYSLLGLQLETEFLNRNFKNGSVELANDIKCYDVVRRIIDDARRRILAISIVHQLFYKYSSDMIDFSIFLKELLGSIGETYTVATKTISVNICGDPLYLCLDHVIPCGLIINEIITNSYKHAFINKDCGTIDIELHQIGDKNIIIASDDGSGMSLDKMHMIRGLGISLIHGLVEQLRGTIDVKSDETGTRYRIEFNRDCKY